MLNLKVRRTPKDTRTTGSRQIKRPANSPTSISPEGRHKVGRNYHSRPERMLSAEPNIVLGRRRSMDSLTDIRAGKNTAGRGEIPSNVLAALPNSRNMLLSPRLGETQSTIMYASPPINGGRTSYSPSLVFETPNYKWAPPRFGTTSGMGYRNENLVRTGLGMCSIPSTIEEISTDKEDSNCKIVSPSNSDDSGVTLVSDDDDRDGKRTPTPPPIVQYSRLFIPIGHPVRFTNEIYTVRSPLASSFHPIHKHVFSLVSAPNLEAILGLPSIYKTCEQYSAINIDETFKYLTNIRKIGEGVYGEVYLASFAQSEMVYKIVPVEGADIVNGETQMRFEEIESEILIAQRLNGLRLENNSNFTTGFGQLYRARVCEGKYPSVCLKAWRLWSILNDTENDCLDFFKPEQKHVVFEYEFSGIDFETFVFDSGRQAFSVLIQITHTLATAECAMEFEHRDLHWGNVLAQDTEEEKLKFVIDGEERFVDSFGVKGTIIDYTMSRAVDRNGEVHFLDLSKDKEQFLGDAEYQFEIYRMMQRLNGNEWKSFHPKTNLYWCHYLVDKLIKFARFSDETTEEHQLYMKKLLRFQAIIMEFSSCTDFVKTYPQNLDEETEKENLA